MKTLILKLKDQRLTAFSVAVLIVMLIMLMGILSLASLNDKATKGYLVNKLESERQDLITDGEISDMLILRARSLEIIESSDTVKRMVKPDRENMVYVTPITVVAQR